MSETQTPDTDVAAGTEQPTADQAEKTSTAGVVPAPERLEELEEAMRDVVDPELGINVVDLGLVYGITEDEDVVILDMTLTSAACPLTDVIEDQARGALVRSGLCNWVWLPPWGPDKITEDGREQLRALGFTV
jgi:metal-sulfur cluster biosynthetic enzyme